MNLLLPVPLFATALLAVFLVSCGPETDSPQEVSGETPASPQTLTILSWPDNFPPEVFEDFEQAYGVEIEVVSYQSSDEAIGLLTSSPEAFDVILTDEDTLALLAEKGLLAELDHSLLPGMRHLSEDYIGLDRDAENRYTLPYAWGTTVLCWNSDLIDEPPHTWNSLWDPDVVGEHPVYMLDEPSEVFGITLMALGKSMNSGDPGDIAAAGDLLEHQLKTVNVGYPELEELLEILVEGEFAIAPMYSIDALMVIDENPAIRMFVPQEGAATWIDSVSISSESRNIGLAHVFLERMLDPHVAAACANYNWSASPNKSAIAFIDQEVLDSEIVYPPEDVMERCQPIWTDSSRIQLMSQEMRNISRLIRQNGNRETSVVEN